jgi:hypothetical protein
MKFGRLHGEFNPLNGRCPGLGCGVKQIHTPRLGVSCREVAITCGQNVAGLGNPAPVDELRLRRERAKTKVGSARAQKAASGGKSLGTLKRRRLHRRLNLM